MHVQDVPGPVVRPTAGTQDQPRRIPALRPFRHLHGIVLAPGLVEHAPTDDGWMVAEIPDHLVKLMKPVGRDLRCDRLAVLRSADHVLDNQQTEAIGMPVPARRMGLDMHPHHVAADIPEILQVIDDRFVARRGQHPVRPVSLVQRAEHDHRFAVEQDFAPTPDLDAAQAGMAFDGIDNPSLLQERQFNLVKVR